MGVKSTPRRVLLNNLGKHSDNFELTCICSDAVKFFFQLRSSTNCLKEALYKDLEKKCFQHLKPLSRFIEPRP